MGNARGLRTRLCPECKETTPHRTLYARATISGRRGWLQVFWACTRCSSLNHIILPAYKLEHVSSPLPSTLTIAVVNTLEGGPLDLDELIMGLRQRRVPGINHIFNSEVELAIQFLKARGVVVEETKDLTETLLERLRARAPRSGRRAACPAEPNANPRGSLVTLYEQRKGTAAAEERGFVSSGIFCLHCSYHQIEL
jgi:hypothetical protein